MMVRTGLVFVGMLSVVACAAAPPKLPPGQALVSHDTRLAHGDAAAKKAGEGADAADAADMGVLTPSLHVAPEIAQLCGLPSFKAAPHFGFDSTQLAPEDRDILSAVAKCMSDGPLRGRSLALVGRTDPRGETEYNFGLGEARADSVRRYLRDLGIAPERVAPSSSGELDALGTNEPSWSLDRRVDIATASR